MPQAYSKNFSRTTGLQLVWVTMEMFGAHGDTIGDTET